MEEDVPVEAKCQEITPALPQHGSLRRDYCEAALNKMFLSA